MALPCRQRSSVRDGAPSVGALKEHKRTHSRLRASFAAASGRSAGRPHRYPDPARDSQCQCGSDSRHGLRAGPRVAGRALDPDDDSRDSIASHVSRLLGVWSRAALWCRLRPFDVGATPPREAGSSGLESEPTRRESSPALATFRARRPSCDSLPRDGAETPEARARGGARCSACRPGTEVRAIHETLCLSANSDVESNLS
jgi:hypothetical protein